MNRIRILLYNEKVLMVLLIIQLLVYWGYFFCMADKSEFVAYQRF